MEDKNSTSEVLSGSDSSASSPRCCKAHRASCVKKRDMDTSEWKFIEDYAPTLSTRHQFDPWKAEMPSTQSKEKSMLGIDHTLQQETRESVMEEIRNVVTNKSNSAPTSPSHKTSAEESDRGHKTFWKDNGEILENFKAYKAETNPYLVLLNRLDEEEGIKTPSVEDKLKLAEDRLRISINTFCEACDELVETSESAPSKVVQLLKPEVVREAFRPKVFEPSLLPPQTLSVSEMNKKPMLGTTEGKKDTKTSKQQIKIKGIHKQGFYLPSDTWFTQEKEIERLTPEELELLNSTSTKAFLRFLDERKKEPPKVLQDIQKKLQETQMFEKHNDNEK